MQKSIESLREELSALERRLARAEKRGARRHAAAAAVVISALLLTALGAAAAAGLVPDFLAARAFRVVDQSGDLRAALRAAGPNAVIVVGDPRSRRRREFIFSSEPPYLTVRNESGRVLAALTQRDAPPGAGRRDRQQTREHEKQRGDDKKGKGRKSEESDDGSFDWLD